MKPSSVAVFLTLALATSLATGSPVVEQFLSDSADTNNFSSAHVAPDGTIHGAWEYFDPTSGGVVNFATWSGTEWIEITGSALTGDAISSELAGLDLVNQLGTDAMKVDGNGDLHVALHLSVDTSITGTERGIAYGFYDVSEDTWAFQRIFFVMTGGNKNMLNGEQVLLLDSSGHPHIIFGWDDNGAGIERIEHAFFDGTDWNTTGIVNDLTVENVDSNAGGANLFGIDAVIDSSDDIHVSYTKEDADKISGDVWYASRSGTTWTSAEIADTDFQGGTSIALDGSEGVHIGYAETTGVDGFTFKVSTNSSGSFVESDAGTVSDDTADTFLAPSTVNLAINAGDQRVLSAAYGAYDATFGRIAEEVVVSSEAFPGNWSVESFFMGDATTGNFGLGSPPGAMVLRDDKMVAILQGVRPDSFDSGQLQSSVGVPDGLNILPTLVVGVAKDVSVSGSVATFNLYLENLGNVPLESLALPLDLDAVFGAGNYVVTSAPSFIDDPATITLDGSYNGSGATQLISTGSTLAVGDTAQIQLGVFVRFLADSGGGVGVYSSQVSASAQFSGGGMTSDLSDSGTDPDPNGNNDPTDAGEDDPTTFMIAQQPVIGVAHDASVSTDEVTFDFYLENFGNVSLNQIALPLDLDALFGAGNYEISTPPALVDDPGTINLNGSFDGAAATALFLGTSALPVTDTAQVRLVVSVNVLADNGSGYGVYSSQVTASALAPNTNVTSDLSDSGTDPDPNGNGNPIEAGEGDPTPITVAQRPVIGVSQTSSVIGRQITLDFYLESLGNVPLQQVSLPVDLDGAFGAGNYAVNSGPTLIDDPGTFVLNGSFNGSASRDLLNPASSTFAVGDTARIRIVVDVTTPTDQGDGLGMYDIQVTASAQSPDTTTTSDLSDNGTDPDPNGNGNPGDAGEGDSGTVTLRGTIGDLVWNDLDGDGVRDGGEPGLPGVTVFADLNGNGSLDGGEPSVPTSGAGAYDLTNLADGTYSVRIDESTLPVNMVLTGGSQPTIVMLTPGADVNNVDFGYSLPETPSLTVDTTDDVEDAFDEQTSVREALDYAATLVGSQTVDFAPALNAAGKATITVASPLTVAGSTTVQGPGVDLLEINGGTATTVFVVDDGTVGVQTATFADFTIADGTSAAGVDVGGGIINRESLQLTGVVIENNSSPNATGGVHSTGPLSVIDSLIVGNFGGNTGGISVGGSGFVEIANSTFSGNTGTAAGAVAVNGMSGQNSLVNVTVTAQAGQAVAVGAGATVSLANSIVAGNPDGDFQIDVAATVNSNGANFVGNPGGANALAADASFVSTGTTIDDVLDTTLADNGGATRTYALKADSPALDSGLATSLPLDSLDRDGDSDTTETIPFDQRGAGFPRVVANIVDMGALEATFDVYVDDLDGDFTITNDNGAAGLDDDDIVTWKPGTVDEVSGLLFGTQAFTSIQEAVDAVNTGGRVQIASGTYVEGQAVSIVRDMSLIGDGADVTEISGNNSHGGVANSATSTTISGLAIRNGAMTQGGGISNSGGLSLVNSTVANNNSPGSGGGIFNDGGSLSITNSTISGNNALAAGTGGGIYSENSIVAIRNSTISGNTSGGSGGGIYSGTGSSLAVANATVTDNTASDSGGGIFVSGATTANVGNSIVAGNTATNADSEVSGVFTDNGGNLTAVPGGSTVADILAPLAANGGTTMTHALVPESPAIDGGISGNIPMDSTDLDSDLDRLEPIPFDQRGIGFSRVIRGNAASAIATVDIGAFELFAPPAFADDIPRLANTGGPVDLFELTGATPDGGVFTGTGVSGATFDPTGLAAGDYEITYTVTDANGVSNSNRLTIQVFQGIYRPDLRNGDSGNAARHKGDNIYSGGQTYKEKTDRPKFQLYFSVENDGNVPDSIITSARGISNRKFDVRIREQSGSGNVTATFLKNGHVAALSDGGITVYQMKVSSKDKKRKNTFRATVKAGSEFRPEIFDSNTTRIKFDHRRRKSPKPRDLTQ